MKRPPRTPPETDEIDLSQIRVQLKPVLGIQPAVYLTVLYGLAAAALLFFLLVYPGLRSHGTYVTFVSTPVGAAITVDGHYRGATPAEILVPAGERTLGVSWPGMTTVTQTRSVRGPVFATLLIKPRDRVVVDLTVADPGVFSLARLENYAAYAHEKGNGLITETARVLTGPGVRDDPAAEGALRTFLESSMGYLAPSGGELSDYLGGWGIHSSGGGVLGPGALVEMTRELAGLGSRRDYWLAWFLLNAPSEVSQHAVQQAWVLADLRRLAGLVAPATARPVGGGPVVVAGVSLRPIPGGQAVVGDSSAATGTFIVGPQPAHNVSVRSFYMAETEVTNRQYAMFLAAVPEWRKSEVDRLVAQGLVADQYLETWAGDTPPSGSEDLPVTHVSWAAATAYARWLTTRLPASLAGHTVRLPWEAEWEWAARGGGALAEDPPFRVTATDGVVRAGSTGANGYGLRETQGNVWEWCADWYAPAAYFLLGSGPDANSPSTASTIPVGTERVVRGGAWANEGRQVPVYARGSQPPTWTTPYLGFRVVAAPATP